MSWRCDSGRLLKACLTTFKNSCFLASTSTTAGTAQDGSTSGACASQSCVADLVDVWPQVLDVQPEDDEEEDGAAVDLDAQRRGKCVVLKTSTRQTIFLPVVGLVDAEKLRPGDLVGVNKVRLGRMLCSAHRMLCSVSALEVVYMQQAVFLPVVGLADAEKAVPLPPGPHEQGAARQAAVQPCCPTLWGCCELSSCRWWHCGRREAALPVDVCSLEGLVRSFFQGGSAPSCEARQLHMPEGHKTVCLWHCVTIDKAGCKGGGPVVHACSVTGSAPCCSRSYAVCVHQGSA